MAAREFIGSFRLYQDRDVAITLDCYGPDGVTPLVLQSADDVEARLWLSSTAERGPRRD